jgi:hypothetical protein
VLGQGAYEVTRTSALGRTTRYRVEHLGNDDEAWTVEQPSGVSALQDRGNDAVDIVTRADGTVVTTELQSSVVAGSFVARFEE